VIVTGPPQAIAIGPAGVIEIGRKLVTPGVAKTQAKGGRQGEPETGPEG